MWKQNPKRRVMILKFISDFGKENKRCPTVREIGNAVGLRAVSAVWWHLDKLGFVGDRGWNSNWRMNKKEYMSQWVCPTCGRDLDNDKRK